MEGIYPTNPSLERYVQTDVTGLSLRETIGAVIALSAAEAHAPVTNGVHAAVTDNGSTQTLTTGFTNPPYPSNLTVTYGGTDADIKGGHQLTFTGTDMADQAISETLPAATANTPGTVVGSKIFKTVDPLVDVPAHDGNGATTAIGYGAKKGIPIKLRANTVKHAHIWNGSDKYTREGTPPTVGVHPSTLCLNYFQLSTSLSGQPVLVYLDLP